MSKKVRALYDFDGEPGSAELSIRVGDVLTITREDVGSGWMEGSNDAGRVGLFPETYVEIVESSAPPSMPPPQLPANYADPSGQWTGGSQDGWYQEPHQEPAAEDFWDDDWDEDSEGGQPGTHDVGSKDTRPDTQSMHSTFSRTTDVKAPVKKNFNRFSVFVKSGGEDYILGNLKVTVLDIDRFYIVEYDKRMIWNPITEPYTCAVASPKKESKLKGLKSFIAYQVTPSFNNIQVSRRYKHFDWLHERLEEKFSLIPIPPLPDKQISGRYEEQFIEHRRVQLQAFVNCVCRHPVLSRSAVWQHFMTCTDDKRWKAGKRRAEKDELVGANYFACLQVPEKPLDTPELELQTENTSKFVHSMDNSVKNLIATANDQSKKHQTLLKREYQRIGQSFLSLGNSFEMDDSADHLTQAIKKTGEAYNNIGKMFEDQPKADWEPLADRMHIYKGMLASYPDILNVHKSALQKYKEVSADNRMDSNNLVDMKRRTDVMSYALLAEISHFHSERAIDFKEAMNQFLLAQIELYQKVVNELQGVLTSFQD